MRRPSVFARFAASPRVMPALLLSYAAIVYGWYSGFAVSFEWYQGAIPWWVAVAAVAAVFRTLAAALAVRRYKAWEAQWDAIGAEDETPRPRKKRGGKKLRVAWVVLLIFAAVLVGVGKDAHNYGVPVLWMNALWAAEGLFLVSLLVFMLVFIPMRAVHRRLRKRAVAKAEVKAAKDADAPIDWLVAPASSSPSRAEATRNLPEYCARLILR